MDQAREDRSTGWCTDAGAGNLPVKSKEQSTEHKRQGLGLKRDEGEAYSGVRVVLDIVKVRAGIRRRTQWAV